MINRLVPSTPGLDCDITGVRIGRVSGLAEAFIPGDEIIINVSPGVQHIEVEPKIEKRRAELILKTPLGTHIERQIIHSVTASILGTRNRLGDVRFPKLVRDR